jgi:hypothetical protein
MIWCRIRPNVGKVVKGQKTPGRVEKPAGAITRAAGSTLTF